MDPIVLDLDKIRLDGGTQPRAQLDMMVVDEYAQDMQDGAVFPPVIVFHDGESYWLVDGFHRVRAAMQVGADWVRAEVRQGTVRDAVLYACGANAAHGLRRTNADKRRAVMRMLEDAEWAAWSDREIGRRCAVSDRFVGIVRQELSANGSQIAGASERTVERNGTVYTVNTANIGKSLPSPLIPLPEGEGDDDGEEEEGDIVSDDFAERRRIEAREQVKDEVRQEEMQAQGSTDVIVQESKPVESFPFDACPKCNIRPNLYGFDRKRNVYKCGTCGTMVDLVVMRAKRNKVEAEAKVCPACGKPVDGAMCTNCGEVIRG